MVARAGSRHGAGRLIGMGVVLTFAGQGAQRAGMLADHAEQREREGAHLCRDMLRSLRALKSLTGKTSRRTAGHAARTRKRIETRVRELVGNGNIDNARLVQEAAVLADRADVNEELVRLASHLDALEDLLGGDRAVGEDWHISARPVRASDQGGVR